VREVVAKLIGMGHPEAWRYRWGFFLTALEAAGESAADRIRHIAVGTRAAHASDRDFRKFVGRVDESPVAHDEIFKRYNEGTL